MDGSGLVGGFGVNLTAQHVTVGQAGLQPPKHSVFVSTPARSASAGLPASIGYSVELPSNASRDALLLQLAGLADVEV